MAGKHQRRRWQPELIALWVFLAIVCVFVMVGLVKAAGR